MYQPIAQQRTGQKLKIMFKLADYDVKYIQEYLNLSCPQPIYRWFKGQNLPTVEKFYALSSLKHSSWCAYGRIAGFAGTAYEYRLV